MPHMSPMMWKMIFVMVFIMFVSFCSSWEYFYPSVNQ